MHHSFDIQLAALYGVEEAILIHHFQYWINFNYRTKRNFREGKYWTYQTVKEISAHFPYMTEKSVRRSIDSLVEKKVLIKGNFNKSSWDRTTWFSLTDDSFLSGSQQDIPDQTKYWDEVQEWESQKGKSICPKGQMEKRKRANEFAQKGTPIPDALNTYLKKDNNNVPPAPKGEHRDANAPDNPVSFSSGDEGEEEEDFEGLILRPQKSNQNLDGYSESTKSSKQPLKPKENSSVGLSLASSLLARILAVHPKLKPPKLESWAREIDLMISIDKREALDIAALIDYIFDQDAFWVNQVRSTDSLRRNFDKIWAKMHPASNRGALIQKNRSIAHEAVSCMKMTETGKTMRITNDYLLNIKTMDQIPFDIDYIEFKARMCASFGLKEY